MIGSGSDLEKQSTLKIRRDEPDYGTGTMPDVIRSRNRPAYNTGDPTLRRNGRYTQLSNEGVDSSDNEYNNMSKLSGAHIAHILTDHKGYLAALLYYNSLVLGLTDNMVFERLLKAYSV